MAGVHLRKLERFVAIFGSIFIILFYSNIIDIDHGLRYLMKDKVHHSVLPEDIENITVYEYEAPKGMTPEDLLHCLKKKHHFGNSFPLHDRKGGRYRINNINMPMDLSEWYLHDQIKKSSYAVSSANKG